MNRIILAGGSGFLGQTLGRHFSRAGLEVVILTRARPSAASFPREVQWDAQTPGPWAAELEGATAVINLGGRSVNCRYNVRNRHEIEQFDVVAGRALPQPEEKERIEETAQSSEMQAPENGTAPAPGAETAESSASPQLRVMRPTKATSLAPKRWCRLIRSKRRKRRRFEGKRDRRPSFFCPPQASSEGDLKSIRQLSGTSQFSRSIIHHGAYRKMGPERAPGSPSKCK